MHVPFPCNVEMLLQSCVATTILQKGAEFSKVFQGFCLRLSEVAGKFRSMRKNAKWDLNIVSGDYAPALHL